MKPIIFKARRPSAVTGRPSLRIWASVSMISRMRARNQGSKAVIAWMSSSEKPSRIAWAITRRRSGVTSDSFFDTAARSGAPGMAISSKPVRPVSRLARAFCSDSWIVRPMAIASPTDFIAVVRLGSEPGNFSKAKRGILVTT